MRNRKAKRARRKQGMWVRKHLPCRTNQKPKAVSRAPKVQAAPEPFLEYVPAESEMSGDGCTHYLHKNVRVEAVVTVTPTVNLLDPGPVIDCEPGKRGGPHKKHGPASQTYHVQQDLMIKIPLRFGADVTARLGDFDC